MSSLPAPTELILTEEICKAINGALENNTPVVVAYVDAGGQPRLSFRGSTQCHSHDQLAIWVRNPEGGILAALGYNPRLTLLYRDFGRRLAYQFYGRGHIETDELVSKQVYERSPQAERDRDPERKGVALIIDLDQIEGLGPTGRLLMERRQA